MHVVVFVQFSDIDSTEVLRWAVGRLRPGMSLWRWDKLVDVQRCHWRTEECPPGSPCRSRHSQTWLDVVKRSRRRCQGNEPASARTISGLCPTPLPTNQPTIDYHSESQRYRHTTEIS